MVLFVENGDSFSFNVVELLPHDTVVVPHGADLRETLERSRAVVIGPGPTDPRRAGLVELVGEIVRAGKPLLGICLGHQAIGLAFGAQLVRATPTHGKTAEMTVTTSRYLAPGRHEVMRYHSLALKNVAPPLRTSAALDDGTVMAIEHETLPILGLQFHPDSYATPDGRRFVTGFFSEHA